MKKLHLPFSVLVISLAMATPVLAQTMSRTDYKSSTAKISATYKEAKAACASLAGNPKDICVARAKGDEKIALTELEASYKPSIKSRYEAQSAKAQAEYDVSIQSCDAKTGNAKDVCIKEAKSVRTAALANAKVLLKTSQATIDADQKSADAHSKASAQVITVRKDAQGDKRDAQYAVEKEKCDNFADAAKDECIKQAKLTFAK